MSKSEEMMSTLLKKTYEELIHLAKLAEAAERYDNMCKFMHELFTKKCQATKELHSQNLDEAALQKELQKHTIGVEERNLLSVAYKNVVGSKRTSWRTLSTSDWKTVPGKWMDSFKQIVEKELEDVCNEALKLLQDGPVQILESRKPHNMQEEDGVFYLKMCGDYYRYLAEFKNGDANEEAKKQAETYYQKAMEKAKSDLPETHPTRLGLALNFSVCYYEILKQKKKACDLAKDSFDKAIEKLDTLNDSSYKDSTLIMQLLRDNLTLWTQDENPEEANAPEPAQ